jgi:hypothetical protein
VGKKLRDEIAQLPTTIQAASEVDIASLTGLLRGESAGRPTVFVGSGGAVAAARFAAQLYSSCVGGVGYVQTPLELITQSGARERAGFLFTARGRHPDSSAAIRRLAADFSPSAVITTNPAQSLISLCHRLGVEVVDLGNPAGEDGFLATNSLIMMVVAVARALTGGEPPTKQLALAGERLLPGQLNEVLVLFPPGLATVAIDLEARLSETGLAAVQIADYRNFAHGRHYGLARRAGSTTVFALVDRQCRELAERTLQQLPAELPQLRLESPLPPPWDTVDLLLKSICLTADAGDTVGLDAGRPRVPAFGRRLYRLAIRPVPGEESEMVAPISMKLRELGIYPRRGSVAEEYQEAYAEWRVRLRRTTLSAIVLDYDGTVVSTEGRYELPSEAVRAELKRLLDAGTIIGFASGRGDSLQQDLRRWVPRRQWSQVQLGLYNGAVHIRLDEEQPERAEQETALVEARERIAALPIARALTLADRHYQLQLTPAVGGLSVASLERLVDSTLRRSPPLPVEAVMSAHSLDILPAASTKVTLLDRLSELVGGDTLAIGDQGQLGGNDFALLAARELSLSVDRCSADPTRCWRLLAGCTGPQALCRYLAALDVDRSGLHFHWRGK